MAFQPPDPSALIEEPAKFTPPDPSALIEEPTKFTPPDPSALIEEPKLSLYDRAKNFLTNAAGSAAEGIGSALKGVSKIAEYLPANPDTATFEAARKMADIKPTAETMGNDLRSVPGVITTPEWKDNPEAKAGRVVGGIGSLIAEGVVAPEAVLPTLFAQGYTAQHDAAETYAKQTGKPLDPDSAEKAALLGGSINLVLGLPIGNAGKVVKGLFGEATPNAVRAAFDNAYQAEGAGGVAKLLSAWRDAVAKMGTPEAQAGFKDAAVKGLDDVIQEITRSFGGRVAQVAKRVGTDAAIGAAAQAGQNATTKEFINPDQSITAGVPEQAATFALVGGLFGTVGQVQAARKAAQAREDFKVGLAKQAHGQEVNPEQTPQTTEDQFLSTVNAQQQPAAPPSQTAQPANPAAGAAALPSASFTQPGPDNLVEEPAVPAAENIPSGDETTVIGTRGTEIPARYVWLPQDQVQASHTGEMLAPNPDYPLSNTRDYSDPSERDKVMETRNSFDPRRHITDSVDASVGPAIVAGVTGDDAARQLVVLGGNNRQWATTNLTPGKRAELLDYSNKRADRFGLPEAPGPDAQIYRYAGEFDLRQPGTRDRLQGVIDALNPAPGMIQGAAKMAENDAIAGNVKPEQLVNVPPDADPKTAQEIISGLIGDGTLDRNTRSQIVQSPAAAQDYLQRLIVNAGFRVPQVAEARADSRRVAVRGMIDAAAPVLVNLRAQGEHGLADTIGRAFTTTLDYLNRGHALPEALDAAARQREMGPDHEVAQAVAAAMRGTIEKDSKGKLDNEATLENLRGLFADIHAAVKNHNPSKDLFGIQEWVGGAVERGIELNNRRRGITPTEFTPPRPEDLIEEPLADMEPGNFVPPRPEDIVEETLLAPNGKPSRLTPEEWAVARTPEFKAWFGDWEALAQAKMPRKASTLVEAKNEAKQLVNRPLPNETYGMTATVSGNTVAKMGSESAAGKSYSVSAHALAMANLDTLFLHARREEPAPDRAGDPNIKSIQRFFAPMLWNGQVLKVKLTVKEFARPSEGNRIYSVEAMEIEKPARNRVPSISDKQRINTPQASFEGNIDAWLASVNPELSGSAVDENGEPTPAAIQDFLRGDPLDNGLGGGSGMYLLDHKGNPYAQVELRGLDNIKTFQMPELVKLCKELFGTLPELKKLSKARGLFVAGRIALDWRIFENPEAAAKTLAHEIGHGIDYLPDKTLARGNILGRLATLKKFRAEVLADDPNNFTQGLSPKTRTELRRKAEQDIGPRPPATKGPGELQAWKDAVAKHYAQLIAQRCQMDKLVQKATIREELIALTQWWKPYDAAALPESYVKYRESSPELYADALSVLFNSPYHLKEMAPTFWRVFFNYLDRKPEVQKAFFEFNDWLGRPALERANAQAREIKAMFGKGEEIFLRKVAERELQHRSFAGWFDRLKEQYYDRYDPIIRKQREAEAAGRYVKPEERMDWVFEEHVLAQNPAFRWLQRMYDVVVKPAEANGFTLEDVGELLFLNRILNEDFEVTAKVAGKEAVTSMGRSKLANPLGITPQVARRQLLRLRLNLGMRRMTLLEDTVQRFHDMVFEVMHEAHKAEMFDDEKLEMMRTNRNNYAAFVPLDYVDTYVPSSISRQTGTFAEIANPFVSTVLKAVAMHRAAQVNRSKLATVRFLNQHFPAEVAPAETYRDGSGVERPKTVKEEGRELLQLREKGSMAWYVVDDGVAGMFEELTPAHANAVIEALGWTFNKIFYPIFIQYNPVFMLWNNPLRDFQKAWRSLYTQGPISRVKLLKTYWQSWGDAAARVRGETNPILADMLENFAIGTPYDMTAMGKDRADAFGAIMERFHLLSEKEKHSFGLDLLRKSGLAWLGDKIQFAGNVLEALPKIGAWKVLTQDFGMSRPDAAEFIRNYIGIPNVQRRGKYTTTVSKLIPFFNVWMQGLTADARLATRGFKGKGAARYWFAFMAGSGILAIIRALADLGVFGNDVKKLQDGISDYDKTNYMTLPVGTMPGGDFGSKTVYARIPMDETDRLLAGILYKSLTTAGHLAKGEPNSGWGSVFAFGAGQTPGIHPLISFAKNWTDYLSGQNPMDGFRNRPILSNDQWLAGGWDGMKGMIGWTWQQAGLGNFVSYNPNADTSTEFVMGAAPLLNRVLKVSDYGYREQQKLQNQVDSTKSAEMRLAMPDNVKQLSNEYNALKSVKLMQRTDEQQSRYLQLAAWYNRIYRPTEEMILRSQEDKMPTRELFKEIGENSKAFEREKNR
ncbi:MAG: hypothetical protein ACFUZC_05040 [Chthoniobacteraceae bacterium]